MAHRGRELDAKPVVALRRGTWTAYYDAITSEPVYPCSRRR